MLVRLAMDAQTIAQISPAGHGFVPWVISIGGWSTAGVLIGAFHFLSLKWNVSRLAVGRALLLPVGIQLVRFALTAAVLIGIARAFGATPLLLATLGICFARTAIIRFGVPP